jgi:putative hemolysin
MQNTATELIVVFALVLIGGFFAAAEIALISARRALLKQRADEGVSGAAAALRLLEDPSKMLAAVQVGVTLIGFLASAAAAVSLSEPVTAWFVRLGLGRGLAGPLAVVLTTLFVSYLSLVFGELVPKRLGLQRAERVAIAVSAPILWLQRLTAPVVWVLTRSSDVVGRLIGLSKGGRPGVTEEEIKLLVVEQNTLLDEEKKMIAEVFELGDTQVKEIMIPRVDMVMLEKDTPLRRALDTFRGTGFSRLPVYEGDRDTVVGVLLLKDMLGEVAEDRWEATAGELARPARFVPETKQIIGLLNEMQASRNQIAIVVDEHGGTEGLVTLEDIIEEVVGDVSDEYDRVQRWVTRIGPGDYLVDGRLPIEEATEDLDLGIEESDEYETLAGWVLCRLGRIPEPGETIEHGPWRIRVANVRRRRIARLRVTRVDAEKRA